MVNKLGIRGYKFKEVENIIINNKLNIIDETFTFNKNKFDFDYLICINDFLFQDFYYKEELGTRELLSNERNIINNYLELITYTCIKDSKNIQKILNLINEVWTLQPFVVGNTRTLIAFLKVLKESFLLDIEVDVNKPIKSSPDMFKLNSIVNQKRLTITK